MTVTSETIEARADMLIRRPVDEVFEAFVNPEITSKFWFTGGSGRLEEGSKVRWDWEMYGFSANVDVIRVMPNRRIHVEWYTGDQTPSSIEWTFQARPDGTTFVRTRNWGFDEKDGSVIQQAISSTEGFTFVLAGAKAWLENGIQLNLVRDRLPDGLPSG